MDGAGREREAEGSGGAGPGPSGRAAAATMSSSCSQASAYSLVAPLYQTLANTTGGQGARPPPPSISPARPHKVGDRRVQRTMGRSNWWPPRATAKLHQWEMPSHRCQAEWRGVRDAETVISGAVVVIHDTVVLSSATSLRRSCRSCTTCAFLSAVISGLDLS